MMATYLQSVSATELDALKKDPTSINTLDQPVDFRTHFAGPINYLLTGTAWPNEHPLAGVLYGNESVETATLENGAFGVVSSEETAAIREELAALNLETLIASIASWDIAGVVEEEEMYELEVMTTDEIAEILLSELPMLVEFYNDAANDGCAVVTYTT